MPVPRRAAAPVVSLLAAFAVSSTASGGPARSQPQEEPIAEHEARLAPRVPFPKGALRQRPAHEHRLVVKFHDHVGARPAADGSLISVRGVDVAELATQLAAATASDRSVRFRRLMTLTEAELATMLDEAAQRSGRAQPDLGAMMAVDVADADVAAVAAALHASDLVELVDYEELWPQPPGSLVAGGFDGPDACADTLPRTPQMAQFQDYLGEDPGMNMAAAWAVPGGDGAGVRIADCEYWFRPEHEDLCDVVIEPGQQADPESIARGFHEHGTAVLGQLIGGENAYGVQGIAPAAEAWFFPEASLSEGYRRVASVTNAIATMDAGDVVLLEMQARIPPGEFAPAEIYSIIWQIVRVGTDRGVTIVAAAGNGNEDLDSALYDEYRSWGDSGAIIVGAGTSSTGHHKLSFSTYGSRVDVQGWGHNVFTAGYGHFAIVGGDRDQSYTDLFSGTSSASPFIAGLAASLQGIHKARTGQPMDPVALRQLLIDTGRPQGAGGHIGPFPDAAAAVDALLASLCEADLDGDGVLTVFDFLAFQNLFDMGDPAADFDGSGTLDLFDFLAFQNAFDAGCP